MKRRQFLNSSFVLASTASLSSFSLLSKALAESTQLNQTSQKLPRFLVQIVLDGGWHTSLATDPWTLTQRPDEADAYLEYRQDEIIKNGNLFLGPALASLKPFSERMNFINGIFISTTDSGHEAARNYMTSGRGTGEAGSIAVEYELSNEASALGVIGNSEIYKGMNSAISSSVNDLRIINNNIADESPFQNSASPISRIYAIQKQRREAIENYTSSIKILNEKYKNLSDAYYIACAFRSGLALSADLRIFKSLDTHADHPGRHKSELTKGLEEVSQLLTVFKSIEWKDGISIFDLTTFYITSDFSRTPALDASKGTNHNPLNNSAIVIGPGFKGNQVFGESRLVTRSQSTNGASYLVAQMVDIKTGEVLKSQDQARKRGTLIKPEIVISTIADSLKIQRNIFSAVDMDVPSIKQLLKG